MAKQKLLDMQSRIAKLEEELEENKELAKSTLDYLNEIKNLIQTLKELDKKPTIN